MQKLHHLCPHCAIHHTSVPSFSTIATGFWAYQYATVNAYPGLVIYTNTAPRKDNKESRIENEGEHLAYGCRTCHLIAAQGPSESVQNLEMSLDGLEFHHPEDIGEAWREFKCTECHTPEDRY